MLGKGRGLARAEEKAQGTLTLTIRRTMMERMGAWRKGKDGTALRTIAPNESGGPFGPPLQAPVMAKARG
jgi:hypothetical protein